MTPTLLHLATTLFATLLALSAAAAPTTPRTKLSSPDREFLFDVLANNQIEFDASAYVAAHAQSPKVRQFAQAMAVEHAQLATAFQKANDGIVVAPGPTPQPGINLLGRTGVEFDRAYLTMMAGYEDAMAAKFRGATYGASHGQPIRDMVKATLPTVLRHAAMAKALERTLPPR